MKTISEYLLTRPGDPDTQFSVYMPQYCHVLLYAPDKQHEGWRVVVKVRTVDVTTDEFADFETRWDGGLTRPTQVEIAQVIINMLAHEVQEQLGLNPHGGHIVIPMAR